MRELATRSPAPALAGRSPAPEALATPQGPDLVDLRPQTVAQRKVADLINASPRMAAQRKLDAFIQASPHMVAQRKLADDINTSPRVVAHAKREADLLAPPAQRATAPGNEPVHRIPHGPEEDETHQLKSEVGAGEPPRSLVPVQRKKADEKERIEKKIDAAPTASAQAKRVSSPNRTGMPDQLKAGIESLSGIALDDVKVHYNSSQPAQLNALAYAQGSDIHLGPGQERHLPHEAWHVVQQKQGRVKPTFQAKGAPLNEDAGLERQADVMGAMASRHGTAAAAAAQPKMSVSGHPFNPSIIQKKAWIWTDAGWHPLDGGILPPIVRGSVLGEVYETRLGRPVQDVDDYHAALAEPVPEGADIRQQPDNPLDVEHPGNVDEEIEIVEIDGGVNEQIDVDHDGPVAAPHQPVSAGASEPGGASRPSQVEQEALFPDQEAVEVKYGKALCATAIGLQQHHASVDSLYDAPSTWVEIAGRCEQLLADPEGTVAEVLNTYATGWTIHQLWGSSTNCHGFASTGSAKGGSITFDEAFPGAKRRIASQKPLGNHFAVWGKGSEISHSAVWVSGETYRMKLPDLPVFDCLREGYKDKFRGYFE